MRVLIVVGSVLLAALAAAPAALGHHTASATGSLTLEPLGSNCKQRENAPRSRCNGSRVARVDWSGTCGAERAFVEISYLAARPNGKAPVVLQTVEDDTGLSGVTRRRIGAGTRVLARVTVNCSTEGDGDTIEAHTVEASAVTETALIAPRLVKVEAVTNGFCGLIPTNRQLRFAAQAGETVGLDYTLEFDEQSLLGVDSRKPAGLRRQWLVARGAGVRFRERPLNGIPTAGSLLQVGAGARFAVRRKGRLRFHAVIGGIRTNSLSFPVLGRRC